MSCGKKTVLSFLLLLLLFGMWNVEAESLTHMATTQQAQESRHNRKREAEFKHTESDLSVQKQKLEHQKLLLQKQIDSLTTQFSNNENKLAQLEQKLRLQSGSLGEVFGVVRQNTKEFQSNLMNSVTLADHFQYQDVLAEIVQSKTLPSLTQLKSLWRAFTQQITASEQIKTVTVTFVNQAGEKQQRQVIRIGNLALVGRDGYLHWDSNKSEVTSYRIQPDNHPTQKSLTELLHGETQYMTIDPSRGALIEQLENTPTLIDRLKAGGVIGDIIIGLLVIGMGIAVFRAVSLFICSRKIKHQLNNPEQIGINPLGRVLNVYQKDQHQTVEALELRLLEVVVDEQSVLERGLSMLKLLAALAPMLGLLGTVTGMIETFQVITVYGNGDPKIMAGGISMALVTTVLGLVAAMPLLLAHNVLSTQAESIRNRLEKQGIALVAAQAETECKRDILRKAA